MSRTIKRYMGIFYESASIEEQIIEHIHKLGWDESDPRIDTVLREVTVSVTDIIETREEMLAKSEKNIERVREARTLHLTKKLKEYSAEEIVIIRGLLNNAGE